MNNNNPPEMCQNTSAETILWGLLASAFQQINDLRIIVRKLRERMDAAEADLDECERAINPAKREWHVTEMMPARWVPEVER